ncbi:MAG: FMN-dependent NADH-azoreductase [Gammaproteobacteria bacterium]
MKSILAIKTSIAGDLGASSQLVDHYVAKWLITNPDGRVLRRDLTALRLPHLSATFTSALSTAASDRSHEMQELVTQSDELINELRDVSEVVVGIPMYNFNIPSVLQSYFDNVARAGVTFRYSPEGPIGLLPNKRTVLIHTRGGQHLGTARDIPTAHVQTFLSFLGIQDSVSVYAEGLARSETSRSRALDEAKRHLDALTKPTFADAA